jgi:hypothetical protein
LKVSARALTVPHGNRRNAPHILAMKKANFNTVKIRQSAAQALFEIEEGEVDLPRKEIASRAILSYHKAWCAKRNASRKAVETK